MTNKTTFVNKNKWQIAASCGFLAGLIFAGEFILAASTGGGLIVGAVLKVIE